MPLRALGFVLGHITAFLVSFLVWVMVLMVGLGVVAALSGAIDVDSLQDTDAVYDALGAGLLGALTLLQNAGLVGIAAALAALVPLREGLCSLPGDAADLGARLRRGFGLRTPAWPLLLAGAVGAFTVGLLPSWIAEQLIDWMPSAYEGTLEMIPRLLADGPAFGRAVLAFSIVVGAPLLEELVFRGYLWTVFDHVAGPVVAFVSTTLLFALFHGDPVHVVSLLPTAAFLGVLRLASGSVWPAVAAHFVNNGLGALIMLTADPSVEEASIPLWLALLGLAFTVGVTAIGWSAARRRSAQTG